MQVTVPSLSAVTLVSQIWIASRRDDETHITNINMFFDSLAIHRVRKKNKIKKISLLARYGYKI